MQEIKAFTWWIRCCGALSLITRGLLLWLFCTSILCAAGEQHGEMSSGTVDIETADVVVDGRVVLKVRGTTSFPAKRRAAEIEQAIIAVAKDANIPAEAVVLRERANRTDLVAGDRVLADVFEADAKLEGLSRKILAESNQGLLQEAIVNYRHDRDPQELLIDSLYALAVTFVAVGLLFGFRKGFRSLNGVIEQRLKAHLKALEAHSARFVKSQELVKFLRGLVRAFYAVLVALTLYFSLNFVLGLYPWTRGFSVWLFDLILDPLQRMGEGLLASIPDLVFLVVLYFVIRYLLRMIQVFFRSVDSGSIKLQSFEQDWAWPTYRILRLLLILFAMVMAYPHIPGSQSDAFKGISILMGLIISLGSSSIIGNIIAGYSLSYRRPFRIGDRVRINDLVGDVMEIKVLVTRLRSLKNEEIIISNTTVLNGEVINYTTLAHQEGLILHTTVGIGYETPWRQVEAMLKLAASRTSGLLKKPKPFVLEKELGDFAVTYEVNAYCTNAKSTAHIYAALHRNILDVFNEYGVAIMTPSYVEDPPEPKLVPEQQWYSPPARPPSGSGST
jgi:small-conductance mechanosensitive channel